MQINDFYSVADAARLLGVQEYRIQYAHRTGKVTPPELFAGRRLYRRADLQRLAKHFEVKLAEEGGPCT